MEKLFLDANILFSAAYREYASLLQLWQLKGVKLITSVYAHEEARRNLNTSPQQLRLIKLIKKLTIVNEITEKLLVDNIKLVEKDRPILTAAIAAKANYLITGDFKDFGPFFGRIIQGVTILPPREYLKLKYQNDQNP